MAHLFQYEIWTLGKPYRIKPRCYWESLGNNFRTWGTPWEQDGNTFGNKRKNKNNLPHPAKQKKTESIECLLIDCMKLLFSK
jgi:hypothetical protein